MALRLGMLGEAGRAGAWVQRAQRLVEEAEGEISTKGLVLISGIRRLIGEGGLTRAEAMAREAIEIGIRCADADCAAFARCQLAQVLIRTGRVGDGLAELDEAMLAASGGALNPVLTGLVYCITIAACRNVHAHDRSREWTEALSTWCDAQPQLVEFNGICRVHRAEILEMAGDWAEASAEARRAEAAIREDGDPALRAAATYQQAEIARLKGQLAEAGKLYTDASRLGMDPQPGLALLRLAQGRADQGLQAIRRAVASAGDQLVRARLLPAQVELALAAGDAGAASEAADEMGRIAGHYGTPLLQAMADQAQGCVALAGGDAAAAIPPLRRAFDAWQNFGAPYIAARLRMRIGAACAALGDAEGAGLEYDAARGCFADLGAAADLAEAEALLGRGPRGTLTARETEVLRMVAEGLTNRAIAAALGLSEKTVDRHVSNIFDKFGVSSRAAATAHGFRHDLLGMGETTQSRNGDR
jgi:ATP/maltotriose-dependent transcriptional regulator MalT